jgi:aminopeptidase N
MTDAGVMLHYFYQENERTKENWENLHAAMNEALNFMNANYGRYPYPMYAFIQGGDGGMEYPMATLITGERNYRSLVGVAIHEWMHSWYQMMLGTNESLYAWMDEGFTSFASSEVLEHLKSKNLIPGELSDNPHYNTVRGFARWAATGNDEALTTHADHYTTNQAYSVAAYAKGAVFLKQLEYIIGDRDFRSGLKRYFNEWKFKHPNVNDFIRVMEKESGIELDWYKEYFVNTTHTIDYAIDTVIVKNGLVHIELKKIGAMPMPLDIEVKLNNGGTIDFNIPLVMMRGEKSGDRFKGLLLKDWPWTNSNYTIETDLKIENIKSVIIDPSNRVADIDIDNNIWPKPDINISPNN